MYDTFPKSRNQIKDFTRNIEPKKMTKYEYEQNLQTRTRSPSNGRLSSTDLFVRNDGKAFSSTIGLAHPSTHSAALGMDNIRTGSVTPGRLTTPRYGSKSVSPHRRHLSSQSRPSTLNLHFHEVAEADFSVSKNRRAASFSLGSPQKLDEQQTKTALFRSRVPGSGSVNNSTTQATSGELGQSPLLKSVPQLPRPSSSYSHRSRISPLSSPLASRSQTGHRRSYSNTPLVPRLSPQRFQDDRPLSAAFSSGLSSPINTGSSRHTPSSKIIDNTDYPAEYYDQMLNKRSNSRRRNSHQSNVFLPDDFFESVSRFQIEGSKSEAQNTQYPDFEEKNLMQEELKRLEVTKRCTKEWVDILKLLGKLEDRVGQLKGRMSATIDVSELEKAAKGSRTFQLLKELEVKGDSDDKNYNVDFKSSSEPQQILDTLKAPEEKIGKLEKILNKEPSVNKKTKSTRLIHSSSLPNTLRRFNMPPTGKNVYTHGNKHSNSLNTNTKKKAQEKVQAQATLVHGQKPLFLKPAEYFSNNRWWTILIHAVLLLIFVGLVVSAYNYIVVSTEITIALY